MDAKDCKKIDHKLNVAKIKIAKCINKKKYEDALQLIHAFAGVLYEYNQYYCDEFLEKCIQNISANVLKDDGNYTPKKNTILFFDAFGLNSRGLAQIYLKALCKKYNVIYVTYDRQKNSIPDILEILDRNNGIACYLKQADFLDLICQLNVIIQANCPEIMFMYDVPDDVIGTVVFSFYKNKVKRFQINLTDHAFWLGATAFDYCLEFRNYGAFISTCHRNIDVDRLIMLPYYPIIDYNVSFEGYPFPFNPEKNMLIFSGGALYKTRSGDNKYYQIVDYILSNYPDVIFWYAGFGDRTELDKLISKYPHRCFFTGERKDLYEILRRSTFYLSTYPVAGGLMFQYAALAGKVPVTLKFDNISDDILINQSELNVEFTDCDEMKKEIEHLISDIEYRHTRECEMRHAVISENEFEKQLFFALENNRTSYPIVIKEVNTIATKKEYIARYNIKNYYCTLVKRNTLRVLKYFSVDFLFGGLIKVVNQVKSYINR